MLTAALAPEGDGGTIASTVASETGRADPAGEEAAFLRNLLGKGGGIDILAVSCGGGFVSPRLVLDMSEWEGAHGHAYSLEYPG